MTDKVLKTIEQYKMLPENCTLGIGLSGGADSVCLAHILSENRAFLKIKKIIGIHIHHGIRGDEADRDALFTKKFCEKNNIEFLLYNINVPDEAAETGESIEECARRLRYLMFEKSECDVIATAHNLNDNIETFIFNLSRGSSLSGLCGIPYKRDIYIRPLLDCTRNEIEEYIINYNLSFVTDSTNLTDEYARNKIRHNILPVLFELNPSFDKSFTRCMDSLTATKEYICECATEVLNASKKDGYYDCRELRACHRSVENQAISMILSEQGVKNINRNYIDSLSHIVKKGGCISFCDNIKANVERDRLFFGEIIHIGDFEREFIIKESCVRLPIGEYIVNIYTKKDLQNFNKQDMDKLIDCDKIVKGAVLRNRRDGDNYKIKGRPGKSFKKLFNENKIPNSVRDKMLVLSDETGIVWTEFFGVSEFAKVDDDTENFIKITKVGES